MSDQTIRRHRGSAVGSTITHLVLAVGGLIMVFPFVWQILMSLSTNAQVMSVPPSIWPGELQFENYAEVFRKIPFLDQLTMSVVITVLRTVGQLVLCTLAGYAFARMAFRGKNLIFAVILSLLMVPPQIYLIPQYLIVQGAGLLNTPLGVALPGFFSAFGIYLMRQAFSGLPDELEEAARLDGANPFQIFFRIMLPLVGPSLSALVIITVLWSWNDLLWPLVVTTRAQDMPLSVGLATLQGQFSTDYSVMMAASLLAMLPVLILFLVLQRRVVRGLAFSGMKG
ncbi:carbohydrate ABC transporter permease [Agromyces aerolatus]|uniref:carbohydrate ABC transporter permease n=1 Tax=Agromyces sp. LY-1074 TaxID=3074080 RepID=UPI0028645C3C|nr:MULTISPECIES: carbohydrate ABC transporter permease [unclassified Agromyces]MDR5700473.1 carbohydrate ABC transporter permease [Agromyces sp. LY-1074]MDR5706994.1 carbohydrate ABC transporter permease [Agromyces sp. LY-1358]